MNRTVIYLSGPLTKGDRSANVFAFMQAHEILMDAGFSVVNPGLTALLPWAWEKDHADWIACDLEIVERCDMLVRLPGESKGADQERWHAIHHLIPVLHIDNPLDLRNPNVIAHIRKYVRPSYRTRRAEENPDCVGIA